MGWCSRGQIWNCIVLLFRRQAVKLYRKGTGSSTRQRCSFDGFDDIFDSNIFWNNFLKSESKTFWPALLVNDRPYDDQSSLASSGRSRSVIASVCVILQRTSTIFYPVANNLSGVKCLVDDCWWLCEDRSLGIYSSSNLLTRSGISQFFIFPETTQQKSMELSRRATKTVLLLL